MPIPQLRAFLALVALWFAAPCLAQQVFINEIHYDNASSDAGEFVEIAGPAGTNLAGYELVFYNGSNGSEYDSDVLTGTIPNEAGGYGALAFFVSGIQNGGPDGVALFEGATLVEFLSYEGSFTADGVESTDIGVSESSGTPIGDSLQRTGMGAVGADFSWTGPLDDSPGLLNAGQSFAAGEPTVTLTIDPASVAEDAGAAAASGTLSLIPAPTSPVVISMTVSIGGEVSLPATVTVGVSGSATFDIDAIADGIGDGDQVVEVDATAPGYLPATALITVFDIDPPAGRGAAYRFATYNIQNGVGQPGDPAYEAVLRVLRRVAPDAVSFTETDPDNDFAQLRVLLAELGFDYLATTDDGFTGQSYSSGDFGAGQAIAFASRWPITRVAQIGRGEASRRELTRFPLFVQIDVPGVTADPSFVAVHFKAGGTQEDIFRRAVEAHRVRQFLAAEGIDGNSENVFVLGDVNEDFEDFFQNSVFTGVNTMTHVFGDGSTFPASYLLGADLSAGTTLDYTDFPKFAFTSEGVSLIDSEQLDGEVRTYNVVGDARLDYVMAANATISNGMPQTEVYNSSLEFGADGLPKLGAVPFGSDSYVGSDHHLVFGDFALEPVPRISLSISPSAVDEAAIPSITGSVSITPPAVSDTVVALFDDSGRFEIPATVVVPRSGAAVFSVGLRKPGGADPDGDLRITAYANGHMPAHDFVRVTGRQASGALLFSGYVEPASGGSPKAVEIVNASGVEIDFADTPMRLLIGTNGASPAPEVLRLRQGRLPADAVFVVGGATAGDYLVGEGLLANPGAAFTSFETGTPFLSPGGEVVFVYRPMFYNGDDALAIQLSYTLADTFGTVGDDPGASWSGGGVSSANQNLMLRGDVGTGSPGWTDPSERWISSGSGNSLTGFGEAPVITDPYVTWARSIGLFGAAAGPAEDLNGDGWTNLMNFALGGERPEPVVVVAGANRFLGVEFRQPNASGRVTYLIETSGDLQSWSPASVVLASAEPDGGMHQRVVFRLLEPIDGSRRFLRVRVTMP